MRKLNINKFEMQRILKKLKIDAVKSEGENQRSLKRIGVSADIIADKQYWNGYLDSLGNIEEELKGYKDGKRFVNAKTSESQGGKN